MMLTQALFLGATFVAVLNNASLALSALQCLRVELRRLALLVSFAGWVAGYVIEGPNFSLPQVGNLGVYLVPLGLATLLTLVNYPTSITQLYVATLLGYSLAYGYAEGIYAVVRIAVSWVLSVIAGLLLSVVVYRLLRLVFSQLSVSGVLLLFRVTSLLYVFLISYVLGGNLLGFLASALGVGTRLDSALLTSVVTAVALPTAQLRRAPLGIARILFPTRYVSTLTPYIVALVLTQVANRLGIPLVVSLVVFSATLGTGLSSGFSLLYRYRVPLYLLLSYVAPVLISLLASYGLTLALSTT
jgi:phosphate/sulfate permease